MLYTSWRYACANGLLRNDVSEEANTAIQRRLILAQVFYAAGFACCLISILLSIVAIALIQFGLAFAPTIWWFKRQALFGRDHHGGA